MVPKFLLILGSALALASLANAQQAGGGNGAVSADGAASAATYTLSTASKPWKGDFDGMLQRRMIRVDAPYSRSLYFVDKGKERGIGAELVRDFERWVNQKCDLHGLPAPARQLGQIESSHARSGVVLPPGEQNLSRCLCTIHQYAQTVRSLQVLD